MRTFFGSSASPEGSAAAVLEVHVLHADHGVVVLPSRDILLQSMYSRAGSDLVITSPENGKYVVKGFFLSDPAPSLTDGADTHIGGELVTQFAGSPAHGLYGVSAYGTELGW